jgi:hypothetical protein
MARSLFRIDVLRQHEEACPAPIRACLEFGVGKYRVSEKIV